MRRRIEIRRWRSISNTPCDPVRLQYVFQVRNGQWQLSFGFMSRIDSSYYDCRICKNFYCRALFTTTLHSREKTDILLPGVTSEMMNLLLEYAYLRSLDVNRDNVCELLVTADYLSILGVLEICCEFLRQNLAPENCIGIMRFAREHFCKGLENDAYRYVMRHFVQVRTIEETL